MSYIPETNTRDEYLNSKSAVNTRKMAESSLAQFGKFTESEYHKTPEEIISDLKEDDKALEKIYTVLNKWITWLGQDHPEIITYLGKYKNIKKTFKAIHPNTQKQYLNHIKGFLEDVGGFDINSRRLRKRVRLPKAEEEEPEPLTKEELRILLDNCSNKKKIMLMLMKDSGMRIGEVLQLKKKDFDMNKTPIEIHIPAFATKTRKSRTTFATRETRHILQRRLNQLNEDELVFGTNDDVRKAVNTQISELDYMRYKIGNSCPRFLEKYDSNGRYKITLHSLRSFTATQCAEAVDESFAHGIIGHKKYLGQYIRNQDKLAEKYLRAESNLMIYETVEIIEHSEEVNNIQAQLNKQGHLIQELLSVNDEKTKLLQSNNDLQKKIMELELKIQS
ncbi:hypothetical protein YTPLAS73_04200 [Nitrosarchaeum sp.]|nr:hypothetical protein YTPLAS73_04200 [Nitrosarchaeum sp.]